MGLQILEPNLCIRGCCTSKSIPLHLHPSTYTLLSPIARGAESVVYEGVLDGRKMAVKKPILSTSEDMDKFHRELQLLWLETVGLQSLSLVGVPLGCIDHPGIARLVAAHAKPPNYMFFFELYEAGNLAGKLHVEEWCPSTDEALMITVQLAKALEYLHANGIVHRDVKPANILLGSNHCPYLSDFGLAEHQKNLKGVSVENWRSSGKPTGGFHKKNMVGTLIYMAPEILRKEIHTEKSDVYSFGISINASMGPKIHHSLALDCDGLKQNASLNCPNFFCCELTDSYCNSTFGSIGNGLSTQGELLTGIVPYTDLRAEAQAHTVLEMNYTEQQLTAAVVSEKLRPALARPESGASTKLLSLIQKCWDENPQNRPSFSDIILELAPVLEQKRNIIDKNLALSEPHVAKDDPSVGSASNLRAFNESVDWSTQGALFSKKSSFEVTSGLGNWVDSSNDPQGYRPILSWGSFATCGRRETMEDAHFLKPHMCGEKDIHVFGIFDGHRGAAAAQFSVQALPGILKSLTSMKSYSPASALSEAFIATDIAFRKELDSLRKSKGLIQKDWHPGCTALVALLVKNKLFVANAGDCRAILCRAGHVFPLSKDHVASCIEERDRVVGAGGEVKWLVDTWRVGPAALQVTRSIGDDDLKPVVTAEPEITETTLSEEDEFLVMASDGLWDVVSNEEVITIIRDTVKEPGMCSKRLATEAAERGSKDNITVIVVFLRSVSTAERIY